LGRLNNPILNNDLKELAAFFRNWHLQPSPTKTIFSVFHLYNINAHHELNLCLNDSRIRNKPNPVYLGVMLDRSLSFQKHLQKTAAKVATRNNLLSLLAGSSWGASAATLRTSALAFCYSTSRHPVRRVNPASNTIASVSSQWREDWQSATVINSSLVDDPTVRPPGFHLRRREWSLPFPDRTGSLRHMSKEMGSDRQ